MRKLLSLLTVFVVSMLAVSLVSALDASDVQWGTVKVNGDEVQVGADGSGVEVLAVEEGQTLSIRVGLVAANGANEVEVQAKISGYEYSDEENLEDSTELFDVAPGTTKYVNLDVTLPERLEKDEYWLRVSVFDKNTPTLETVVRLAVEPARHGVDIKDVVFSPGNSVKAGRSLLATVLLRNYGDKDERDVKVTVEMPELGVKATEFVDVLETDNHNVEYEDVSEMFLPVPANAEAGDYEVRVTVEYDDLREEVSETYTVTVVENEMFQSGDTLVLAVGPQTQNVAAGSAATYGVALTNAGYRSTAYVLEVVPGDWATAKLSESLVVLNSQSNKVVYVEVTAAADAPVGDHSVSLVVKSASGETLETVPLKATVVQSSARDFSLRNGLEVALIVLVVLLVIVGLVIGFSRLRKDDNKEESTTYY